MGRESRSHEAEEAERASPLLSPQQSTTPRRGGGSFSYPLPTLPRTVSVCQLAGGASEEESIAHKRIQRKLIAALCLAFVFMIIEVVGGIYAHSLAIITDAAHLLSDVSGFAVAVLAAVWAKRRSQEHFSYGYHRVEVLGALASVMTVWLVTGILLFEAVQRIINPEHVDGKIMFIVALAGVGCNVLMMAILGHNHGHGGSCSHSHGPEQGHSHSHGDESDGHAHGKAAKRGLAVQAAAGGAAASAADLEAGESRSVGQAHGDTCCGHVHSGAHGAAEPQRRGHDHSNHSGHSGHSSDEEHGHHHQEGDAILGAAGHKHGSSCGDHVHAAAGHGNGSANGGGGSGSGGSGALAVGHSHSHDHANLNVRGAIIHVIGDFVQSVGVAIAGALIWWHQDDPRWYIADPICTFLFALLVLWTTRAILRDISDVLMERVPRGLCIKTINDAMSRVAGVEEVHDLHVWSLTPGIPLLCAHINLSPEADPTAVLHELNEYCRSIGIGHSTIQLVVNGCACPCAC